MDQTAPDDTRENSKETESFECHGEEQDQHVNTISLFYELPMYKEEYEPKTIFNVQHSYNTISKGQTS